VSYATTREVVAAIGEDILAKIQNLAEYSPDLIKTSRAEAAAEIDSYICAQAKVPVDTARRDQLWQRLRDVEISLVKRREWAREDVEDIPKVVRDQYDSARKWLESVQNYQTPILTDQNSGGMSVPFMRGSVVLKETETLEFNGTTAANAVVTMEYGDSGQPIWIARKYGRITYGSFRGYGAPSQAVTIKPFVNGVEISGGTLSLSWTSALQRGYVELFTGSYEFAPGDRISLDVRAGQALLADVDLKVWLGLEYDN
jgi:phage gp36-like protein